MVGLTGGIGSGKSTVAELLKARGAVVVDADAIARQVVEPEMPALAALVERFGADILQADGTLDRGALAKKAFVDDESRQALEAITHPAIGEEFLRRVAAAPPGAVVVHDVPLLVESKRGFDYGAVIVDEGDHFLNGRSSSAWAKYADALRRISLAWRSSRTSRSRVLIRSRSSLIGPARRP